MQTNSPAKTRRVYKLLVYGSNDSLFDKIQLVEAVGIGAISNEFLIPFLTILDFKLVQSYLLDG